MRVIDIVQTLAASWWLLLLGLLVGGGGALALSATVTPTYVSTTTLFVAVRGQADTTAMEIASGSNAAQQKIKTYTALAGKPVVLDPVVAELDDATTGADLAAAVSASSPTASTLMTISVTDPDPVRAAELADAVAASLRTVVTTVLEPEFSAGVPSVSMEVVEPALPPASPSSPRTTANLAAGALLGLAAGAAAALARRALDTKVRDRRDLAGDGTADDLAVVGEIPFDSGVRRRPVIVRDDSAHAHAEAFRMLRTNIRFLGAGSRARSFAVTSATPGEGKTTTAANLAVSLADSGLRTVVVDADMRRPNLARVLGLEGAVGLSDVLIGRVELDDVLQHWGRDGLVVLPAGDVPPNPSELLGSGAMRALLDDLGQRFDVVVVDTPPLLSVTDAALVGEMVTSTLLVVAAGRTRRDHVATALDRLAVTGTPRAAVLTMTRRTRRDDYSYYAEGVKPLRGARALLRPFRGGRALLRRT